MSVYVSERRLRVRLHSVRFFGALLEVAGCAALISIAVMPNDAVNGTADRLFGGGVFVIGMWVIWQMAVAPGLVVEDERLTIRNPLVRWDLGRRAIASVDWDDDTVAVLLNDGRKVQPFVLRESLIGRLAGSRKQKAFMEAMHAPEPSSARSDMIREDRGRIWVSLPIAIAFWAAFFFVVTATM